MKNYYKIGFCGLGSIGKRHLKNTVRYLTKQGWGYEIDAIRSGMGGSLDMELSACISRQYTYEDCIPADYDIIFITNPTAMHRESIRRYQDRTKSMFIEKPVLERGSHLLEPLPEKLTGYVACPLRYTKVLQYVKQNIDCQRAYSVRAVCSTYLPGWHPGEDYRKSYSARKSMGGGVGTDLIHEWDYLLWLFGKPEEVRTIQAKVSELEIDSNDIAVYIGRSDHTVYELHLDYFGKAETRKLEIHFPEKRIVADIRNGKISFSDGTEEIVFEENRDDYQIREIAHFFDIINGVCENDNSIEQAMEALRIASGE